MGVVSTKTPKVEDVSVSTPDNFATFIGNSNEIQTSKFGLLTIHEFTLEGLVRCGKELAEIIKVMPLSSEMSQVEFLSTILSNDQVFHGLRIVAGEAAKRPAADFVEVPVIDWLKILECVKRVNDWEELRKLFFQLVPPKSLEKLKETFSQSPVS